MGWAARAYGFVARHLLLLSNAFLLFHAVVGPEGSGTRRSEVGGRVWEVGREDERGEGGSELMSK